MTTLFDSARPVKSARPFALGISARREHRMPYTAADLAWAAQHLNENATGYDVIFPTDSDLTRRWLVGRGGLELRA